MSEDHSAARNRDAVVEALIEHFARDHLRVEEFEARVDQAHAAGSPHELQVLLADLPSLEVTAVAVSQGTQDGAGSGPGGAPSGALATSQKGGRSRALAASGHERNQDVVFSVWGNAIRKGTWRPARSTTTVVFQAGAELDFREAILPPGETKVVAVAVMGGIDILVPPGVRVEGRGVGLMGGWDQAGGDPPQGGWGPPEETPVLRISGVAFMGAVDIQVRLPGESARDAKRRKRAESTANRRNP
ncbi:MAG: DUF1707 domain-containing protein [Gemmatimonadota bacterium]